MNNSFSTPNNSFTTPNNSFGTPNNIVYFPVQPQPIVLVYPQQPGPSARFDKAQWYYPPPPTYQYQQLPPLQHQNYDELGASGSSVTSGEEYSGQDNRWTPSPSHGQEGQQQQQLQEGGAAQLREELDSSPPMPQEPISEEPPPEVIRPVYPGIRDVWRSNLRAEIRNIVALSKGPYDHIAIDTEFPGVVASPVGTKFKNPAEYNYQMLRANCDILRLIQLGITLMDKDGNLAPGVHTWQFNFHFSLSGDMYARNSIEMLIRCGLLFEKHETDGIKANEFAELFIMSGLMLNEDVKWISFHGGYDCGYLYKLLSGRQLPEQEAEFLEELRLYFPVIYDVKYLMMSCRSLRQGGLQELANTLKVQRIGEQHQAGSDSLITGSVFFKLKEEFFEGIIEDEKYNGHIYGFGSAYKLLE